MFSKCKSCVPKWWLVRIVLSLRIDVESNRLDVSKQGRWLRSTRRGIPVPCEHRRRSTQWLHLSGEAGRRTAESRLAQSRLQGNGSTDILPMLFAFLYFGLSYFFLFLVSICSIRCFCLRSAGSFLRSLLSSGAPCPPETPETPWQGTGAPTQELLGTAVLDVEIASRALGDAPALQATAIITRHEDGLFWCHIARSRT